MRGREKLRCSLVNRSDFYYSLREFEFEHGLIQSDYTECQNCHYIVKRHAFVTSGYKCSRCGHVEISENYPFPPYRTGIRSIYHYLVEAYYRLLQSRHDEQKEASEYLKERYPSLNQGNIGQIIHDSLNAHDFIVIKDIQTFCEVDEKNSVFDSMVIANILNRYKIESTYIVIQTLTLFEMWLSLLVRRILLNNSNDINTLEEIIDSIRYMDKYFILIRKNSHIKKTDIIDPIFKGIKINLKDLQKIRNDIVHRGMLVTKIEIVQKAVKVASRFLPTFVDIFNKHLVKP